MLLKGEGEIKVIGSMQETATNRPWSCKEGDRHAIIGADSDLYLIALISCRQNVFITPDHAIPHRVTLSSLVSAFSREALALTWSKVLGPVQLSSGTVTRLGLDICLLAALASGNDYLPALQVGE